MQVERRPFLNVFVYACLIAGSVLFTFPFVWMVSSSVKVDRELYQRGIVIQPDTPHAPLRSPYVDLAYYREPLGPEVAARFALIERVARTCGFSYPSTVDAADAARGVAQGLARKLEMALPPSAWKTGDAALEAEIRRIATPPIIASLFEAVYRQMAVGQIRARAWSRASDDELGAGLPMAARLRNTTPAVLKVSEGLDHDQPCATLEYDFTKGDRWRLEGEFTTDFDLHDLHRLRLQLRMDDSWHRLDCTVEKLGALYKSEKSFRPGNPGWVTLTWQEPGPEDDMTRMRTWIHLKEVARGPRFVSDPHKIRLAFELRRSTQMQAWLGKIWNNYAAVLAQIPVGRYVMTSLYLVILNITLILISSSLVAYSIARLRWPGRDWYFLLMLATMMIPPQVTMIPGFLIWKHLGGYNTL
ncbi:MAG: hypothetical protein M1457_12130, partial [bacterium]|nr:hypothetical protein [bacterium]